MADSVREIRTTAEEHPMLVVRGPKSRHQPMVGLAHGSSTLVAEPGTVVLEVAPSDIEPATALPKVTRFFLHETERFAVSRLGRRIGRLHGTKLAELQRLRGLGI